jgi:hypothetical protein
MSKTNPLEKAQLERCHFIMCFSQTFAKKINHLILLQPNGEVVVVIVVATAPCTPNATITHF